MMRILAIISFVLLTNVPAAWAVERIALIIGNSSYTSIAALPNPRADAELMTSVLQDQGFETTVLIDADQAAMKKSVVEISRRLRAGGPDSVGLFYYAGHGIQAGGRNYLIPVEAALVDVADLDLVGVEVDWVMRMLEFANNKTNIVILDACRNNPFEAISRSVGRGLARVSAPTGSFVAYATAPGGVADDGDGANSPFTTALAKAIPQPGKSIEQVFKQVRVDVLNATGGKQTPWDSSSLVSDFVFNEKPAVRETKPVEISLWQSVSKSGDPGRIALFLQVYPDSEFAPEAKKLLTDAMTSDLVAEVADDATKPETRGQVEVAAVAPEPEPTPRAAPKSETRAATTLNEAQAFELARQSGTTDDYDAFLQNHPEGVFADLARAEMAALAPQEETPKPRVPVVLSFSSPLSTGDDVIVGKSLEQLAQGTPSFPPVDGLDEAYWKDQSCSYCHNWTKQALCDQGGFYNNKAKDGDLARIRHPYGGSFKQSVAEWASTGCN